MRQLVYALHFTGRATPVSLDGSVLTVATTAPSCILTATVEPVGLASELRLAAGGEAEFAGEVTITGETSFQEIGTIAFGDGNVLRFATVGSGYLGSSPDPGRKHGGVVWRVTGGERPVHRGQRPDHLQRRHRRRPGRRSHHFGVIFVP